MRPMLRLPFAFALVVLLSSTPGQASESVLTTFDVPDFFARTGRFAPPQRTVLVFRGRPRRTSRESRCFARHRRCENVVARNDCAPGRGLLRVGAGTSNPRFVTADTSHEPMSWLKATALLNMLDTAAEFHPLTSALKALAPLNMILIAVTADTIHEPRFWLKALAD